MMTYCHTAIIKDADFDAAVEQTEKALQQEGFGVLTRIDVQETLQRKLGAEFPRYVILGACNPQLAHKALQAEPHIGVMLPCNVVVRELESGAIEVVAVDPIASMQAVNNPALGDIAGQVQGKMLQVVARLARP